MRTIIRIAKTELRVLFYSPIAWLILVIFAFQIGMQITEGFDYLLKIKLMGKSASNLTKFLLTGGMGAFSTVLSELYLYIPLLTMGLMSRELSSGLIKLLYSSPLSNRQIIFGKYISMMVYGLVLMGILFICSIFVAFSIKSPDIPLIFTAFIFDDLCIFCNRIIYVNNDTLSGCCSNGDFRNLDSFKFYWRYWSRV